MKLPSTFSEGNQYVNIVIETPNGSRNKYDYDPENDFFKLKKILPNGSSFPLDFGFIPHTKGEDGDPLDALVFMDCPAHPGCVVECRIIGVLMAEQKEKKQEAIRNDRFIAVANESSCYSDLKSMEDVNQNLIDELVHFFEYYNQMEGKKFKLIKTADSKKAMKIIRENTKV